MGNGSRCLPSSWRGAWSRDVLAPNPSPPPCPAGSGGRLPAGCWQARAAARGQLAGSTRGAGNLAGAVLAARRPGRVRMGCSLTSCLAPLCCAAFPFLRPCRLPVMGMSHQCLSLGHRRPGAGWDPPGHPGVGRQGAPVLYLSPAWSTRLWGVPQPPQGWAKTPVGAGDTDTHTQDPPHGQSIPGVRGCGVGVQDPCPALTCPPHFPPQ